MIADHRPTALRGLAGAFQDAVDIAVQARCHDSAELATVLGSGSELEAVIIDVEMYDDDASRAAQAVRVLNPGPAVLLLTTCVDASLLAALAHERVSCVSAYQEGQSIVDALRALVRGQPLLPPEVQRALMATLNHPPPPPGPALTSREGQVLELAATGLTISQIAATLHISHSTAKTHLLRVYEKLEAPNRSAAVATALARGMLSVSVPAA